MAGIYVHIPFCKQKCIYCDFYSIRDTGEKDEKIIKYSDCLKKEIYDRRDFLNNEKIHTIYIGGGSPSVLNYNIIENILENIFSCFDVSAEAEITIELNPDDINENYIKSLLSCNINRLSIGIQSFYDKHLQFLNRRHNAYEAENSVNICKNLGFDNISIDLIYGFPGLDNDEWINTIQKTINLKIAHISAYHLSYEPGTILHDLLIKGKINKISDDKSNTQFKAIIDMAADNEYFHYEISNFSKAGYNSIHNSNYWKGLNYIGFGPSAHSYNGFERQWNINNLDDYINSMNNNIKYFEKEVLNKKQKFNEYIMLSLRTFKGVDLKYIKKEFGQYFHENTEKTANLFLKQGKIVIKNNKFKLSESGLYIADFIIRDFFEVD